MDHEAVSEVFVLDDRDVIISPICVDCKHADLFGERKCSAFPNGIPLDIWCGSVKHDKSLPGDNGIFFTQMTEGDYEARRSACKDSLSETEAEFEREFPGRLKTLYKNCGLE